MSVDVTIPAAWKRQHVEGEALGKSLVGTDTSNTQITEAGVVDDAGQYPRKCGAVDGRATYHTV